MHLCVIRFVDNTSANGGEHQDMKACDDTYDHGDACHNEGT